MDPSIANNGTAPKSNARADFSAPRRYIVATGIMLLMISVSLNVFLARKVRSFARVQSIRASDLLVKVGTTVPPIAVKRLNGEQDVISYQGTNQPTVLYIFTPPCAWCARNIDNFKTLANKESAQYHFVGVSLSEQGLTEYVAKNELKLPVYSGLSAETLKTYKLGSTPQTIVISPEGKVLQDWAGAYVGDQKSQVEAFFHVSLPGLRELPAKAASTE
jgi:peroxiredoxin